jgi:hypothetical protein
MAEEITQREFLKATAATVVATGLVGSSLPAPEHEL